MVEKNWKDTMMIDHDMDQTDRVTETLRWMVADMNFRREQTGMEHEALSPEMMIAMSLLEAFDEGRLVVCIGPGGLCKKGDDEDGCHYQCEGEDGHCEWEGVCPHDRRGANDGSDAKMKTPELREGYRDGNYRVGHK